MNGTFPIQWFHVALAVVFRCLAGLFAKLAAMEGDQADLLDSYVSPWYFLLIGTLALQAVFWVLALSKLPLSTAYPFLSLYFVINVGLAHMVFGEAIGASHLLGVVLIVGGVVTIGSGARR